MPVYLGDPLPKLHQITTLEKDGYNDHELTSVMHVGTHMDAPLHMIQNGKTIEKGSIVLVYTDFGKNYRNKKYYENVPNITKAFAEEMVKAQVKIIGMDILGPDAPPFPTHKILLGNSILIIENLVNLEKLLDIPHFEVIALPMKLQSDAAWVRVVARY